MKEPIPQNSKEFLHNRHLAPGINPIRVCLGTEENFLKVGEKIEYMPAARSVSQKESSFTGGYIESHINSLNKFEREIYMCLVLVVVGRKKATGENISYTLHQFPGTFLYFGKERFINHLIKKLEEFKEMCEEKSVDAVIVGGEYNNVINSRGQEPKKEYLASIKLLTEQVQKIFNFKPIIENGPQLEYLKVEADQMLFDTANRRLFLVRPKINETTGSFTNDEIEEERKKWE